MRRKRGSPLGTEDKRHPFRVPTSATDKARLMAVAETEGISTGELLRELIGAAEKVARPEDALPLDEALHFRIDHSTAEAWRRAAEAAQLEPTVWLRLLTTRAGRVLLKQLQAAAKQLGPRR